jgi:tetratricopeptide (TPR) repeat protein
MKDPMDLLDAGKYEKALEVQQNMLAKNPNDEAALGGMPDTYLCLGRLEEALEGFQRSNARAKINPVGEKQPYLMHVGTIQWLLGRREDAIRTFRAGVDGILDGTIEFADLAGGAWQGLLLWYAGVSAPDDDARNHALEFMQGLARSARIKYWPGPLAELAIGHKTEAQLLRGNLGTRSRMVAKLFWHSYIFMPDKLKERVLLPGHLMYTLFYIGVKARSEHDEEIFQQRMLECTRFDRMGRSLEWHLARAEVARYSNSNISKVQKR